MNVGDTVINDYLGKGKVIRTDCGIKGFHLVQWEKTPDVRYNMGENPTCVFEHTLERMNDANHNT